MAKALSPLWEQINLSSANDVETLSSELSELVPTWPLTEAIEVPADPQIAKATESEPEFEEKVEKEVESELP